MGIAEPQGAPVVNFVAASDSAFPHWSGDGHLLGRLAALWADRQITFGRTRMMFPACRFAPAVRLPG